MRTSNSCVCRNCKTIIPSEDRILISTYESVPDTQCSGVRMKVIEHFSLCGDCFKKYKKDRDEYFERRPHEE